MSSMQTNTSNDARQELWLQLNFEPEAAVLHSPAQKNWHRFASPTATRRWLHYFSLKDDCAPSI